MCCSGDGDKLNDSDLDSADKPATGGEAAGKDEYNNSFIDNELNKRARRVRQQVERTRQRREKDRALVAQLENKSLMDFPEEMRNEILAAQSRLAKKRAARNKSMAKMREKEKVIKFALQAVTSSMLNNPVALLSAASGVNPLAAPFLTTQPGTRSTSPGAANALMNNNVSNLLTGPSPMMNNNQSVSPITAEAEVNTARENMQSTAAVNPVAALGIPNLMSVPNPDPATAAAAAALIPTLGDPNIIALGLKVQAREARRREARRHVAATRRERDKELISRYEEAQKNGIRLDPETEEAAIQALDRRNKTREACKRYMKQLRDERRALLMAATQSGLGPLIGTGRNNSSSQSHNPDMSSDHGNNISPHPHVVTGPGRPKQGQMALADAVKHLVKIPGVPGSGTGLEKLSSDDDKSADENSPGDGSKWPKSTTKHSARRQRDKELLELATKTKDLSTLPMDTQQAISLAQRRREARLASQRKAAQKVLARDKALRIVRDLGVLPFGLPNQVPPGGPLNISQALQSPLNLLSSQLAVPQAGLQGTMAQPIPGTLPPGLITLDASNTTGNALAAALLAGASIPTDGELASELLGPPNLAITEPSAAEQLNVLFGANPLALGPAVLGPVPDQGNQGNPLAQSLHGGPGPADMPSLLSHSGIQDMTGFNVSANPLAGQFNAGNTSLSPLGNVDVNTLGSQVNALVAAFGGQTQVNQTVEDPSLLMQQANSLGAKRPRRNSTLSVSGYGDDSASRENSDVESGQQSQTPGPVDRKLERHRRKLARERQQRARDKDLLLLALNNKGDVSHLPLETQEAIQMAAERAVRNRNNAKLASQRRREQKRLAQNNPQSMSKSDSNEHRGSDTDSDHTFKKIIEQTQGFSLLANASNVQGPGHLRGNADLSHVSMNSHGNPAFPGSQFPLGVNLLSLGQDSMAHVFGQAQHGVNTSLQLPALNLPHSSSAGLISHSDPLMLPSHIRDQNSLSLVNPNVTDNSNSIRGIGPAHGTSGESSSHLSAQSSTHSDKPRDSNILPLGDGNTGLHPDFPASLSNPGIHNDHDVLINPFGGPGLLDNGSSIAHHSSLLQGVSTPIHNEGSAIEKNPSSVGHNVVPGLEAHANINSVTELGTNKDLYHQHAKATRDQSDSLSGVTV